jgi:hypothetical protein
MLKEQVFMVLLEGFKEFAAQASSQIRRLLAKAGYNPSI